MLKKRKILDNIKYWLKKDEIILLTGMRQVGKTSLLKLLRKELLSKGILDDKIIYLNLEDIEILNNLNESPKNLLAYLVDEKSRYYFLIDEIQYLDNPSNFLKYLYDEHRERVKLIVTGSSSLELKAKIQDSLVGRKVSFLIHSLSFAEFLQFKDVKNIDYYGRKNIPIEISASFKKLLDEYLLFGGMPRVVLANNDDEKKTLLKNYVGDYINKDVRYIGKIDNVLKFNQLLKLLSGRIGGMLNISQLTDSLNIERKTIEFYLDILEQTFVIARLAPHFTNVKTEISKMPKVYFSDLGIRNQIMENFLDTDSRTDVGEMFENFIYLELQKSFPDKALRYYRTLNKSEIDFIIKDQLKLIPVEAKYKKFRESAKISVLENFCVENEIDKYFLLNLNFHKESGRAEYLPYYAINKIII